MDLHMHSNLSLDSTASVEEILVKAQSEGIDTISITDHNSALSALILECIDVIRYFGGRTINGVEICTTAGGFSFELLAYDFDAHAVQPWLYKRFGTGEKRERAIMDKLVETVKKNGFKLDKKFPWNPRSEFAHQNIYRNITQYEQNKELLAGIENGGQFYANSTNNKGFLLYLDISALGIDFEITEVVKTIHDNGGKVFLAHPFAYNFNPANVPKILDICRQAGVDGVEVYNPRHTPENEKFLLEYAKTNKLLISGGSDFHKQENRPVNSFVKLNGLFIK